MACSCKPGKAPQGPASCLGRCNLPKHFCLDCEDVKPGKIPRYLGWVYTAKTSPPHQLRCGWRPGHISCAVLRRIQRQQCKRSCERLPCHSTPSCARSSTCAAPFCPIWPDQDTPPSAEQPLIRIIRRGGQYSICTKPSNISNAPSGPYPLKYVLNTPDGVGKDKDAKFSIEAKFNDYQFDYACSQTSFILDFTPPEPKCPKQCPKKTWHSRREGNDGR